MTRRPPGWLDTLLASGDLAAAARQSRNQVEMCRHIDITQDAFISWRQRRQRRGEPAPTFEELQLLNAAPVNLPERDDFEEEEATVPGVTSPWGVVPSLPPSSFAEGTQPRWQPSDFRNPESLPYEPPQVQSVRKLTRDECPDGTMILWASDIHIPIHHDAACRLMVECAERVGVSRVIAGGDILDMNCLSKHAKESRRTVEHATILEEVEPGRWLLDWFASKQTDFILGNHEDRLKRFVDENPAFHGSLVSNFAKVCELPAGINVLPQGGEVKLGNLTMCHLDALLKGSTGGKYPAQRVLEMRPEESTIGGHVHRISQARRTSRDEHGISRTRCAWTMGHMSREEMHDVYMSVSPNWQMGFALIRVYWEGERPRWSVYPIEVLFDRHNRPYFEHGGVVYR